MGRIFVSVGTHPQQFDRLLKELDRLVAAGEVKASVFAQTGNSRYKPAGFKSKDFLDAKEFDRQLASAEYVVSHGGAGTIINALLHKKPLLVVPRLQRFGEHTNNHQLDLAKALEEEGKALAVFEIEDLGKAVLRLPSFRPNLDSNRKKLVSRLKMFLEAGK